MEPMGGKTTKNVEGNQRQISVFFITAVAALGGLLFGYDTGVISGAQLFLVRTFALSPQEQEFAVSSVLLGAIVGALIGGKVNDVLGRRPTMLILATVFTVGAILTAISPNFWFFVACRILVGLSIGASASVVPVYISEMAPAHIRGALVSTNQLAITIGIAVSYWGDLAFAALNMGWPPMFGIAAIPGILFFAGMLVSPETPRWLASKGHWDQAMDVLRRIKGADPDVEMADIRASLADVRQQGGFRELLHPGVRMALIVGVGLAVFQQFVGINTVIYYAPTIFQAAGVGSDVAAILATSIVGVVNVLATIVAMRFVDRAGRRPLLILGSVGMIIGLLILSAVFLYGPDQASGLVLFALIFYIIAFALSMGPIFWLMSAEIFPNRVRAIGASLCSFANWVANYIVSATFLTLTGVLTQSGIFFLYACIGVLALIFCWTIVPETKGKSLEEVESYWLHNRRWVPIKDTTLPQS